MSTEDNNSAAAPAVSATELKLPNFWPKNPRVWFTQVEARFDLRRITSQSTKYLHVVAALPPEIADAIDDILISPAPNDQYDNLKKAVLERLEAPEQSRLQQLLSREELGDQRPSQLLHRMRQLLGAHARQDGQLPLLRELFLQRLPQSVRVVLAGSDEASLDRLAQLADRITEYSTPSFTPIAATRMHEEPDRLSRLEEKLNQLTETMQQLMQSGSAQRSEQRRNRSPSRQPSSSQRNQSREGHEGVCWYHRRFGTGASRCTQPCSFSGNAPASR